MQYVNQVFNHLGKCQMSNHITEIETQNVVANSKAIIVIHGDKLDRKVKIIDYHIDIIFFFPNK
jgi:hypothetical protein